MITIGYSTRKSNPELQEYLKKSCGHPKTEVIEKVTNGEKNLSQVYNEIISESSNDIVVLCHDDIYFDTKNWGQKLEKLFEKNEEFSIIGIAGTTEMPKSGMWWEDRSKMCGIVNHEHNGKKWESRYSDSLQNSIKEVVIVDGLFIAINKNKIKHTFDETVSGFHMYDVNFCFRNYLENVKIGVTTSVRVTHKSVGETNNLWEKNRVIFSKKYKVNLPTKIKLPNLNDSNILVFTDSDNLNSFIYNTSNYLNKNSNISIISVNKNPLILNFLNSNKINLIDIQSTPGYKLGDGKWVINTPNGPELTKPNNYYKISEPKIDLILFDDVKFSNILNSLYPNTDKLLLLEKPENFNSEMTNFKNVRKILFSNVDIKTELTSKFNLPLDKIEVFENYETTKNIFLEILNSYEVNNEPKKIKILTGFSDKGGSTTAFVNLTNQLNNLGHDCTLYGPHSWHLDKCKSALSNQLTIDKNDILISHFVDLGQRPSADKVILSCHEKNLYEVSTKRQFWDTAVFLNDNHRNYHSGYTGNFEIIPNLKANLFKTNKDNKELIGGVIGSIDENKQTHVSIKRALDDGCEKVYVFGGINDTGYYVNFVKPLLSDKVIHMGHMENKQEMYDMIGRAYLSSISECASLVKDECYQTGTKFFGNDSTKNEVSILENTEIINKWIKLFEE
jgi:hypothetical protein